MTGRPTAICCAMLALLCLGVAAAARADAQAPLELRPGFGSSLLGEQLAVLRDESGALGIDDVTTPAAAARFRPTSRDALSQGLDRAAFWLRLPVANGTDAAVSWLLELGYPHLDHIALYVPGSGGYDVRRAGDRLPFAQREVDYRNVLFRLSEPARSARTYYVRVQTSGAANVAMTAWSYEGFIAHQGRELAGMWMFYGLIFVMAVYNLFIYFAVRRAEYLYYVLYNLTLGFLQFSLSGHAFQYLMPEQIWLVNHMVPFTIVCCYLWSTLFFRTFLELRTTLPGFDRFFRAAIVGSLAVMALSLLDGYGTSLRAAIAVALLQTTASIIPVALLARRNHRPAALYLLAWAVLFLGVLSYLLKTVGVLPTSFVTEWGIQIGAALEVVLLSLALADRINAMRNDVSQLNLQLSNNVEQLQAALATAEQATRAKGDFLATMSHELRTPLNAIINIPQGLLGDFVRCDAYLCSACQSLFELEPSDPPVSSSTCCPQCEVSGSLSRERVTRYLGKPEHTVQHLAMIERSGKHLLQMVNGVLDYSKIEASALRLTLESVELGALVDAAVDTVSALAVQAGLPLHVELDPIARQSTLVADPLRVRQVLINLIGNAIKFSAGRGAVSVEVELQDERVLFAVRDAGIGVAPEDAERIFERFEQIDRGDTRRYGGTGLGLSISRSLVEMHGGKIWVDSEPGAGSVFSFWLPRNGPAQAALSASLDEAEPVSEVLARVPRVDKPRTEPRGSARAGA